MKDWFYNNLSNNQLRNLLEERTTQCLGKEVKVDQTLGRCSLAREHEQLDRYLEKQR